VRSQFAKRFLFSVERFVFTLVAAIGAFDGKRFPVVPSGLSATVHTRCRGRVHAVFLWTAVLVHGSVMGGKPERICSVRGLPPMTQSRLRMIAAL
jgi:hypothetical protein